VTPDEAIRAAKAGELFPVYVIAGEERLLRDRVVQALRDASLGGGLAEFNEDKFTAGENDVDKVLGAVRTVPMMAPRRFCLVRSVERWDNASGGGDSDEDGGAGAASRAQTPLDKLAEYTNAPVDSTCLVLVAEKLDGRRKLMSVARKKGFLVSCDPLDDRALTQFIASQFREKGHAIAHDVAELLAEVAGPELGHVADSVERLSLYAGPGAEITEDAVSACVARVRLADTWSLVDAVSARDLGKALRLFVDVYDPRDRGLPFIGALAWSVRQLARVATGIEAGQRPDDAARAAGVPPFRAHDVAKKAKGFRARELERWLTVLKETDLLLKSSRRPADSILEDMLTRLMRRAA
jgi:DNA polymerase-3 subunit delta